MYNNILYSCLWYFGKSFFYRMEFWRELSREKKLCMVSECFVCRKENVWKEAFRNHSSSSDSKYLIQALHTPKWQAEPRYWFCFTDYDYNYRYFILWVFVFDLSVKSNFVCCDDVCITKGCVVDLFSKFSIS